MKLKCVSCFWKVRKAHHFLRCLFRIPTLHRWQKALTVTGTIMHLETSVKVPLVLNNVTVLLRSESFLSEIPQPLWTWIFCTANRKRWHVKQNTSSIFFISETDNSSTASEASYVNVPPQHEEEDHSAASSESDYDEPGTWWNQHHNCKRFILSR